jgi:hypothetical protein
VKDEEIQQEFWRLIDVVEKKQSETYSLDELEPSLLAVLNFSKKNSDSRQVLEECFIELIHKPKRGSLEVLVFCMHELRWPKIKQVIEEIVRNTKDIRKRDALWDIPEAYSDDWDGREYYKYYSRS